MVLTVLLLSQQNMQLAVIYHWKKVFGFLVVKNAVYGAPVKHRHKIPIGFEVTVVGITYVSLLVRVAINPNNDLERE